MNTVNLPFYYRLLTPGEQVIYNQILVSLTAYKGRIMFDSPQHWATVKRIVDSLHLDRPAELFHVHFTRYELMKRGGDIVGVNFQMLCDQTMIDEIRHELKRITKTLHKRLQKINRIEEKFLEIVQFVASTTSYRKSGNFFTDHTLAGPVICEAVCEGLAMYFQYLCEGEGLKACIVFGTKGGGVKPNHAWNKVYLGSQIRYVDMTTCLRSKRITGSVFRTKEELLNEGYVFSHYLSS